MYIARSYPETILDWTTTRARASGSSLEQCDISSVNIDRVSVLKQDGILVPSLDAAKTRYG